MHPLGPRKCLKGAFINYLVKTHYLRGIVYWVDHSWDPTSAVIPVRWFQLIAPILTAYAYWCVHKAVGLVPISFVTYTKEVQNPTGFPVIDNPRKEWMSKKVFYLRAMVLAAYCIFFYLWCGEPVGPRTEIVY